MLGFINFINKCKFFMQPAPVLKWEPSGPYSFQSGRHEVEADYYDGVVSIYFDGKWIKQLFDIDEAKRWCARDARKRGLLLACSQAKTGQTTKNEIFAPAQNLLKSSRFSGGR